MLGKSNFQNLTRRRPTIIKHWAMIHRIYSLLTLIKVFFKFKRLPYCIASAPVLWKRSIEQVLQEILSTQVIIDEIIVTGHNDEDL